MNKAGRITLFIATAFICMYCAPKKSAETASTSEIAKVSSHTDTLVSKVDTAWAQMMKDDDARLDAMQRITVEIKTLEKYDEAKVAEMQKQIAELKAIRYNQASMADSKSIDNYDAQTDSVWAREQRLMNAHPRIRQYMLVNQLTDEINNEIARIIAFRLRYDENADSLNAYLKQHESTLSQAGEKYSKLKPMPVFRLPEPAKQ